jgi:hypothetical protein
MTREGSNFYSWLKLNFDYNGSTGLNLDPERYNFGVTQDLHELAYSHHFNTRC